MKYRIVSEISIDSFDTESEFFYIQKSTSWLRRRFGIYWRFIYYKEDVKRKRIPFNSYAEAEQYLYKNYFTRHGEVFKNGNIYSFTPYTYNF